MLTVGIDIGAKQHAVARCREGQDKADREILRLRQDRAGYDRLDAWLERQAEPVGLVTMESSGHYWMALASHLGRRGVPVAVVNPLSAKYFAKSRLGRTKSDPADARSLALMAMRDRPVARDPLAGAELRQAARFAMTLVTEQARVCQRLVRLVELGFPELGELFDDPACRTAREVLRVAPTAAAARRRRVSTLADANAAPGHRRLGTCKAERLKEAAAHSIAVPELEAEVAFEVGLLLDQYDLLEAQIAEADARVASLLDGELARRLRTIPGVGASITATLIAEIGDIERFEDVDQLLAYAGVHPAERSSGRKGSSPETSWRMSKAGNAHLRAALYRMAVVGVTHNPVIRAHYARKRAAGKSKMNALGHCMAKALSLVWGVWRNGTDFDPNWGERA
ncbi:MAG TPA: IS110 family transposase [Candidatus Binatia bacterium]|nr:IS110 family transposase [Candidatus Binatia bacterium]